jgi:hypothetical protein
MKAEDKVKLDNQAFIITSCMMELCEDIDPYSISATSSEYIESVYTMVTDLQNGSTESYTETLAEIVDDYSDDEDIVKQANDLIEDLTEYKAAFAKATA